MKNVLKLSVIIGLMLMTCLFSSCSGTNRSVEWETADRFTYMGETYDSFELDLSPDVFYYDADFLEDNWSVVIEDEDGEAEYNLYAGECGNGDKIFYNGTFYCRAERKEAIRSYYAEAANYDWFIVIDGEDEDLQYPLKMEGNPQSYLNDLDMMKDGRSVFVEDAENKGTLLKVSKDGLVSGRLTILYDDGDWCWQTETIDEENEKDGWWAEFIQPLPKPLTEAIQATIE